MFYSYTIFLVLFEFMNLNGDLLNNLVIRNSYVYGKLSRNISGNFTKFFTVPKRWFLHFYILGVLLSISCWVLIWHVTIQKNPIPNFVENVLSVCTLSERTSSVNRNASYIALVLYSLHVSKRLYESLFVSVFSSSRMSIFHYIVGISHYMGAFIGLISYYPGFASLDTQFKDSNGISNWQLSVGGVVILASFLQFLSLKHLADLRKTDKKKDLSAREKYHLPSEGLFAYISCPHYLTEIVVYIGIGCIFSFQHTVWNAVCIFVVTNQVQIALMTHAWYKKNFKDFPLNRKAILPLLL
ncbi:Polyprenol reductase [Armadillidium nasatum]|uniref:Polyprenal reductase n=1 Tax=Armadillidium nasatum TaxID=96803 RepID=A0A5N5T7A7_9CRUS|nr:Polyprenol reductase [Armadillidium nasatum]